MSYSIQTLAQQALTLSPRERVQLADQAQSSLAPECSNEAAWIAEVDRRLDELNSGRVIAIPVEESIARAYRAIQ